MLRTFDSGVQSQVRSGSGIGAGQDFGASRTAFDGC